MTTLLDRPAAPTGRRAPVWLALLAVSLPMFMATLDNLVMTTALPVIHLDLRASTDQLAWFMNAYTLTFATFMLPMSALGDRLGRKRMMLTGITLFTLASIGSALATSPGWLIATRALQGFGAAAIMPLSLALLAGSVPERMRAAAIGIWGAVAGLGVALGPVVGGAVVDGLDWQAIFWLNVPVAVAAVPLIGAAVRESRSEDRQASRLDPIGTTLLGVAVFSGVWGIVHGNTDGWGSARVIGPFVATAVLLPAYVGWARRRQASGRDPVLPLRLFRSRGFSSANAISLLFSLGMFGAVFLLSQYLQIVQGYSPLGAGVRTLPWTAAPMVVAPIAGLAAQRVGVRIPLTLGLVLQTASLVWFAVLTEHQADYSAFLPALALAGIGMGLTYAPTSTAVLDGLPEADFAVASSANATLREFGTALGIALLVAVFQSEGGQLTPTGYAGAIGPALLTGAAAVALGAVAALFAPGRGHRA